jgi:hypothetical protein
VIAGLFAKVGQPNRQLRNPFLVFVLMLVARFLFFPLLILGNMRGRGDCLIVTATAEGAVAIDDLAKTSRVNQ